MRRLIIPLLIVSALFTVQVYGFNDKSGRELRSERSDLESSFRQVMEELTKNNSEAGPDIDRPDFPELIGRAWSIFGEWSSSYLQSHPNASTAELIGDLKGLDRRTEKYIGSKDYSSFDFSAVQLATGKEAAYVLSASWAWTGTFFIVARTETSDFRVVWNIKEVAERNFELQNELGHWAYLTAGYHDGPLIGTVHKLERAKNGYPRFYVDALTNPAMGDERPGQISIWQWNGTEPESLFIEEYTTTYERHGITLKGDLMEIQTKKIPKTFYTCGSCGTYPEGIWKLKIGSEKIENLGEQYVEPEIGLIDDLFYQIQEGCDTSEIATLEVAGKLNSILERDEKDYHLSIGMLGISKIKHYKNFNTLRIQFDDTPQFIFTILQKNGKPYITNLKVIEEQ